jgi:uncharacterized repeat protein (TIGR01451 family)
MKNYISFCILLLFITTASAQSLISINPNQGNAGNVISAVITGQNTFFQSGSPQGMRQINLENNQCQSLVGTNLSVIDDDHISVDFNIPANYPNGIYNLRGVPWVGAALYLNSSFTVSNGTTISFNSITPAVANENQSLNLTLNGQNLDVLFNAGCGISLQTSSRTYYSIAKSIINSNTLSADFYLPAYIDSGNYDVIITTVSLGCYRLVGGLHVQTSTPKQLVSIAPPQATAGNTLSALITSQNTFFMSGSPQGINKVQLKDQHCNIIDGSNISILTDTSFTADFPIAVSDRNGFYDVFVRTNLNTSYLLPSSLEIIGGMDKDLISFLPSIATANTLISATVSGVNTDSIFASNPVSVKLKSTTGFNMTPTNIVAQANSTTMDFQIPIYADNGFYDLEVTSGGGCYSISQAIEISGGQPRQLVSITPNSGYRGQTLGAVITGSNTYFMSGTPQGGVKKVEFLGQMPGYHYFEIVHNNITVQDTDHIAFNMTIPQNMPTGLYNVTVENYAGNRWSLTPGFEIKGTIVSGNVTFDVDSSGTYNAGDVGLAGKKVILLPDSIISISDANGNYFFSVDSGQYTIEMYSDTNWFVTTTPTSYLVNVNTVDINQIDFGMQPIIDEYSIFATLTGGFPRCNQASYYDLTYHNFSTTTASGQIYLVLDSSINFTTSSPLYDLISNDTIFWNYSNLAVNASANIHITTVLPSIAGDTITSIAFASVLNGGNEVANFTNSCSQIIRCSFDPNDKSVEPLGVGNGNYVLINNYLEYTIRFQNTGNDTAFTVMILDTISDAMDMSSFQVIAQSNPVETHLYGNVAQFKFNNILLPDSNINEPASHGFIKYRIKPKTTTPVGTVVENQAGIYFDLNYPITTNVTSNTVTDVLPNGITTITLAKDGLLVFPNPSSRLFTFELPNNKGAKVSYRVFDAQGKVVLANSALQNLITIDGENWNNGIYYLIVISEDGKTKRTAKIILDK